MEQRSIIVSEIEQLIAQFKSSQYSDATYVNKMLVKCYDLNASLASKSFTSKASQFGSEFTPTKKKAVPVDLDSDSDDEESSLSDSESEESSEEERKVPKRKKLPPKKKSAFGGDGGSEESDSSDSDSEEEEERPKPKKILKKKKDPNAPKRPMSAYLFFATEKRGAYKQEHPEVGFGDIARAISSLWVAAPDSEKQVYQEKAQKDRMRYEEEMRQYEAKTSGVDSTISPMKKKTAVASPARKAEKRPDVKRPMSAYMIFVNAKREEVKAKHPELSFGELAMQMGNMWKSMEEAEKKIYVDQAAADLVRYQNELQK